MGYRLNKLTQAELFTSRLTRTEFVTRAAVTIWCDGKGSTKFVERPEDVKILLKCLQDIEKGGQIGKG